MPHDVENHFYEAETLARNLDVNYTIDNNSITIDNVVFDKPETAMAYLMGYDQGFANGYVKGYERGVK